MKRPVPILVHGYDYAVADGRGFLWLGPWLEPRFVEKNYKEMKERIDILEQLINRFHKMLSSVSRLPKFKHVLHVDIRSTLPNDKSYKKWWANELHPTPKGFSDVAQKFADAL